MKIHLSRVVVETGVITGVSLSKTDQHYASIETEHPTEAQEHCRILGELVVRESNGVLYLNLLPTTVLSFIRDFIWQSWNEQGIIELT